MASIATALPTPGISPRFDKLLKDITTDLSQEELKHAVSSIKSNFEGKFNAQGEQDLYSCLHLFANQGLVSEDNLTLLEKFIVTPKTTKKEGIVAKIQNFKFTRLPEETTRKELTGRHGDVTNILTKLRRGHESSVLNLYGSSGVGKTRLAMEALSQWQGTKFKIDLRDVNHMEDVYFHVLQALLHETGQTVVSYDANPVVAKMQQVKRDSTSNILLLLDNVDQFIGGTLEADNFLTLLERLLVSTTGGKGAKLKILLTSRGEFRGGVPFSAENLEVRALEKESSGELLQSQVIANIPGNQRERLVEMCKGKPLFLNGMAAILRQEIADAERLLGTIEQELDLQPQDTAPTAKGLDTEERETFNIQEEGIDEGQLSCLRKMLFFLPSQTLKKSVVSLSLFCRPFSVEEAAKILNVDPSEAAIRMEGIRNSKMVSVPDENELLYDIHPLIRKFLKSIGNKAFAKAYQRAKDNFYKHFVAKLRDISSLLDKNFMEALDIFSFDKKNFELALDISLKSDSLLIPKEYHESTTIYYLFEAMLDEKQRRKIFHSWAEKIEEDGKEGSLFQAEMHCREALEVLNLEGWQRAADVLKEAKESLSRVQEESRKTDLYKLTQSSYLFVQGEVYYRAGNGPKALRVLNRSLEIMEVLTKSNIKT